MQARPELQVIAYPSGMVRFDHVGATRMRVFSDAQPTSKLIAWPHDRTDRDRHRRWRSGRPGPRLPPCPTRPILRDLGCEPANRRLMAETLGFSPAVHARVPSAAYPASSSQDSGAVARPRTRWPTISRHTPPDLIFLSEEVRASTRLPRTPAVSPSAPVITGSRRTM